MNFLEFFNSSKSIGVKFKDRKRSCLILLIHIFFKIINVFNRLFARDEIAENFRDNYTTTIGRTIYSHPAWSYSFMPSNRLAIHELTHVVQYHLEGFTFLFNYLFNKKKRAFYECEAFQAECLCLPSLQRHEEAWIGIKRNLLTYGLNIYEIENELSLVKKELDNGNPRFCALTVYCVWSRYQTYLYHLK